MVVGKKLLDNSDGNVELGFIVDKTVPMVVWDNDGGLNVLYTNG